MSRSASPRRWLLAFLVAGKLCGQTIQIFDGFDDLNRLDGADPFDTSWFMYHPDLNLGGTPPSIGINNSSPLSGPTLAFGSTSTYAFGVGTFSTAALSPGSSITITADFAVSGSSTATSLYGPLLGLFNNGGTPLTADITNLSAATHDDLGYELIYERGLSGNLFLVPIDNSTFVADFSNGPRIPVATWSANMLTADSNGHTFSLTLVLAPNGLDLIAISSLDSYVGAPVTLTGAQVLTTSFNEAIVSTWSGSSGNIDNIGVVSTIPEPTTTAAVSGAVVLGLAFMIRRRRG